MLSVLLLTNCTKDNKEIDDTKALGELVFAPMDGNTEKDDTFPIECTDGLVVTYAKVTLIYDGVETIYTPATFKLGDNLYTQSIKLIPGDYIIKEFVLMTADHIPVKATPMYGSDYAEFVSNALMQFENEYGFTIVAFEKIEWEIDVLCFVAAVIDNFGFVWFDVNPITIRTQCFFGDICIPDASYELYAGSWYGGGMLPDADEVAIFKIVAYRDDVSIGTFYNYDGDYIQDDQDNYIPLCVEYADYDLETNEFEFELWLYHYDVATQSFEYQWLHTWTFTDAGTIVPLYNGTDEDGVVEFVYGSCVYLGSDFNFDWVN